MTNISHNYVRINTKDLSGRPWSKDNSKDLKK